MGYEDKVALITGAAGGIGKGAAEKLLKMGMTVAIADIQDELGKETEKELSEYGTCKFFHVDLTKMDEVEALIPAVVEEFGSVDVLINNAGIPNRLRIGEIKEADYDKMFAVHLKSGFFLSQAAAPYMKAKRWGRIINVSSPRAILPDLEHPLYGICKAAVRSMTEYFSMALARWNIRVNAISPGFIFTPMTEHYRHEPSLKFTLKEVAAGAYMELEDLAEVIWFLISDESLPINGQTLETDMGVHFTSLLTFGQYEKNGHPTSYLEE